MHAFRRLLAQRPLAAIFVATALLLKLVVPAGYMIGSDHGRVTITICSGVAGQTMSMAIPGMADDPAGHAGKDHGHVEMPCAFAGLSAPMLGTIDPILLIAAIAFAMMVALHHVALPAPARPRQLRPPLRGPPAAF